MFHVEHADHILSNLLNHMFVFHVEHVLLVDKKHTLGVGVPRGTPTPSGFF